MLSVSGGDPPTKHCQLSPHTHAIDPVRSKVHTHTKHMYRTFRATVRFYNCKNWIRHLFPHTEENETSQRILLLERKQQSKQTCGGFLLQDRVFNFLLGFNVINVKRIRRHFRRLLWVQLQGCTERSAVWFISMVNPFKPFKTNQISKTPVLEL